MIEKINFVMDTKALTELLDYLMNHEDDIAWSINDFGDIRGLFVDMIGRQPEREISQLSTVNTGKE